MPWHMVAGVRKAKWKRGVKQISELLNSSEGKENIYLIIRSKGKTTRDREV